jgi:hypothetical protein
MCPRIGGRRDRPSSRRITLQAPRLGAELLLYSRKLLETTWVGEKVWVLQLARTYRTLGMLLDSGVSILVARWP